MASKRRASNEALLVPKERRVGNDQRQRLACTLTELNEQFASWVAFNKDSDPHLLWIEGVRDYVKHSIKLLDEGKAFLPADSVKVLQQAAEDATSQGQHTNGSSFPAKAQGSRKDNYALELVRRVVSLNRQFANWVAVNKQANPEMWWLEAARDYVQHANKLLAGFSDVESSEKCSKAATGAPALSSAGPEVEERPPFSPLSEAAAPGFGGFRGLGSNAGSGLGTVTTGLVASSSSHPPASGKGPAPATGFLLPAPTAASTAATARPFTFVSLPTNTSAAPASADSGAGPSKGAFGGFSFGETAPSTSVSVETGLSGKDATEKAQPPTAFNFSGASANMTSASRVTAGGATDTAAAAAGSKGMASGKAEAAEPTASASTSITAPTRAFGFTFTGPTLAASVPSEGAASVKEAPPQPKSLSATATTASAAAVTTACAPKDTTAASSADAVAVGNGKGAAGDKTATTAAPEDRSINTALVAPSVVTSGLFKFGASPLTEPTASAASEPAGASGKTTGFSVVSSDTALKSFSFGSTSSTSGMAAAATTSAFTFGALPSTSASASVASASAGSLAGSIFGGLGAAGGGVAAPAPFSFGAPTTTITTTTIVTGAVTGAASGTTASHAASAFGSAAATSSAPAAGFFFGGAEAPAAGAGTAPASAGFSISSSAPAFTFAAASQTAATEEGEDNEPEQEPDEYAKEPGGLKVDDSMDILFREKARLQVPLKGPDGKLSGWQAKGVGMLSVRKAKTEGAKPFIAMYKDNGGHLYHAYIYKTMKLVVSDKQKSVAFSAVWSPDGGPPAMNPALFQLKAGKNREFESLMLKLQEDIPE